MRDLAVAGLRARSVSPGAGNQLGRYQSPASTNGAPRGADRVVRRGEALRREARARAAGAERRDRHRRRRAGGRWWCRSRRCCARSARPAPRAPATLAGLALVGRHAERGVALHVLDRAEVLPRRQAPRPSPSRRSGGRARRGPWRPRTCQNGGDRDRRVLGLGQLGPRRAAKPRSRSAAAAAAAPPAQRGVRSRRRRRAAPDRGQARHRVRRRARRRRASSSQTGRPPRWQVRCSAGFQPPETARQSAVDPARRPPPSRTRDRLEPAPAARVPTTARAGEAAPRARAAARRRRARRSARRPRRPPPRGRPRCASRRRCW